MTYTTIAILEDTYGEAEIIKLSNIGGNPGSNTLNSDRVNAVCQTVDSIINMYLAQWVPLTSPYPYAIVAIANWIAREQLDTQDRRETVAEDAKRAYKQLEMIAAGKLSLGLDGAGTAIAVPREDGVAIGSGCPSFTEDKLRGYSELGQSGYGHRGYRGRGYGY